MNTNSFFFQAFVYLSAAVLFVPIAKKLGLGSVLGYLLAGVVIGPAVFALIGNEGQDIMHFAEFGVVMMLFLIGLELEPALLWKMRRPIAGLGGMQILFSTIILGGLALALGLPWQQALALGMILSMSSTAIVLQNLQEKDLMRTAAGQSSFSVLLFQDIAVIPMLAMLPLLATLPIPASDDGAHLNWVSGQPAWMQTGIVLGSVVAIILSGQYVIRPLLRFVAATRMREVFTASALLLVVGIAVLMTYVGLSPALGAFLAGVVLAESEYRHELQSDIEPFKGLLLGLFFIAVGASIDFSLIMQQPWTILGLVVGVMLLKAFILLLLGKVFKISAGQNLLFSFGLCQVGEFAFVLFSFSRQEGVLPPGLVNLLMAVVAISMALTPIVMLINQRILMPRVSVGDSNTREVDVINEENPIIIAGFGHFGSTIGRFLRANGINATYLDIDSDRVDLMRKMGFKVYYGDASRYDLLHAAGAERAKIIIIALDDTEKRLEMVHTIQKHFPHITMLVRARNRFDAYEQINAGMQHVYRESIDTSVRIGMDAMQLLGHRAYTAQRAARTFFKFDEKVLKELAGVKNPQEYVIAAGNMIQNLENVLKNDLQSPFLAQDDSWDTETLREEMRDKDS